MANSTQLLLSVLDFKKKNKTSLDRLPPDFPGAPRALHYWPKVKLVQEAPLSKKKKKKYALVEDE